MDIAGTPSVRAAQAANGSAALWADSRHDRHLIRLSDTEMQFIAQCDSFYIATTSESGWPYVQHRGGPAGFLSVIDDTTLAFADLATPAGHNIQLEEPELTVDANLSVEHEALTNSRRPRRIALEKFPHLF